MASRINHTAAGLLLLGAMTLVLASGCSVSKQKVVSAGSTVTTAAPAATATTATTAPPDTPVTSGATEPATTTTISSSSGDTTTVATGGGTVVDNTTTADPWAANATSYRGRNGLLVRYVCPANGTVPGIWGSGPFTDDSGVCAAAVFSGLITLAKGGTVEIKIQPDAGSYTGSTKHGVTTDDYGAWEGSYVFVKS